MFPVQSLSRRGGRRRVWLVPDKKEFVIFILLCLIALGLGYWYGMPDKPSEERAEAGTPPAPTVVINLVTNVLKEVVTNIVAANPQPTPAPIKPRPQPTPTNIFPANTLNAIVEKAVRSEFSLNKSGKLTKADLEKVTKLYLGYNKLTEVPKGLEKLPQLTWLNLGGNPDLTKAQIDELQKALPKCKIYSDYD
jgi:hypothetical protein